MFMYKYLHDSQQKTKNKNLYDAMQHTTMNNTAYENICLTLNARKVAGKE